MNTHQRNAIDKSIRYNRPVKIAYLTHKDAEVAIADFALVEGYLKTSPSTTRLDPTLSTTTIYGDSWEIQIQYPHLGANK